MTVDCDRCAIQDVLGRAIVLTDFGELEQLSEVYHEDAVWTSGSATRNGAAELIAGIVAFRASGKSGPGSHALHFHMPLSITVDGDKALAVSHFALVDGTATPKAMTAVGTYTDELLRTANGWRITRRRMDLI